jgi:hypothetical protein
MDIFGPLPQTKRKNKYIIVFIDTATKWLETASLTNVKSPALARWFIDNIVLRHGAVDRILTDQGRNFCSNFMEAVYKITKTQHLKTTPYYPQCNGLAERMCQTIKNMLSHFVNQEVSDWDIFLPQITYAYNTSVQKSTQLTPFDLIFGRPPKLPIDVMYELPRDFQFGENYKNRFAESREIAKLHIKEAQDVQRTEYNLRHHDVAFKIKELVALNATTQRAGILSKMAPRWTGPYEILKVISPVNYLIWRPDQPLKTRKVNIRRLKRWYPRGEEPRIKPLYLD